MKRLLVGVLTLAIVCLLSFSILSAQSKTRRIYMRVLNANGSATTDLATGDVVVQEDGVAQTVTRLGLSNHPMRIALVVDTSRDSQFEIQDLRSALNAFIDAVPAPHELMLVTTGQNVRVVVQPTVDREKMTAAVSRLFASSGGTLLYDAMTEVDSRFLEKAGDLSPVGRPAISRPSSSSSAGTGPKPASAMTNAHSVRSPRTWVSAAFPCTLWCFRGAQSRRQARSPWP
jgi:hypothetical protein